MPRLSPDRLRTVAFVARCTGSALLSAMIAGVLGLGHPIWAVVSALVVSQDSIAETRYSFAWRIAATTIGLLVAVGVGTIIRTGDEASPLQLAAAVTVCAVIARRWPVLRVCMWTAPIVLMTATPGGGIVQAAIERGGEVILGATIATVLHLALDQALRWRPGPRAGAGRT